MRLSFLGHACFLVESTSGRTVLIDPYEPDGLGGRLRYQPIEIAPDLVVLTHEHADHRDLSWLSGDPEVVRGSRELGPNLRITCWHAAHDELGGNLRSGHVRIVSIRVDGLHVVHCGDLGERLTPDRFADWPRVDVLIVPTGGYYTLGSDGAAELVRSLRPRWVVPCHYRTAAADLDVLLPVERFTRRFDDGLVEQRDELQISAATPRAEGGSVAQTRIVVLRPLGLPDGLD